MRTVRTIAVAALFVFFLSVILSSSAVAEWTQGSEPEIAGWRDNEGTANDNKTLNGGIYYLPTISASEQMDFRVGDKDFAANLPYDWDLYQDPWPDLDHKVQCQWEVWKNSILKYTTDICEIDGGTIISGSPAFTFDPLELDDGVLRYGDNGDVGGNYVIKWKAWDYGRHTNFQGQMQDFQGAQDWLDTSPGWGEFTVTVDTVPPSSLTVTANPSGWTHTDVSITFSAVGAYRYELSLDGGAYATETSPYILSDEGEHTVSVKAFDQFDNWVEASTNAYIDKTNPSNLVVEADPEGWTSDDVVVSFYARDIIGGVDNLSGIDHYEVKLDDGNYTVVDTDQYPADFFDNLDGDNEGTEDGGIDYETGYWSQSAKFYADTAYVKYAAASFPLEGTIAFYIKTDGSGNDRNRTVFDTRGSYVDSNAGDIRIILTSQSYLQFVMYDSNLLAHTVTSDFALENNMWCHVAVSYGTQTPTGKDGMRLYVDGVECGTADTSCKIARSNEVVYAGDFKGDTMASSFFGWLDCIRTSNEQGDDNLITPRLAYTVSDEGEHTVCVKAYDRTGNWIEGSTNAYIAPPDTLELEDWDYTSNTTALDLSWLSAGFEGGISDLYYWVDDEDENTVASSNGWLPAVEGELVTAEGTFESGMRYHFHLKVRNSALVESAVQESDGVLVDADAPTPGVASSPEYSNDESIVVDYAGASDNPDGSGLMYVTLYYKRESEGVWTITDLVEENESGSFVFTPTESGTYYFALVATDNAGNTSDEPWGDGDCATIYTAPPPPPPPEPGSPPALKVTANPSGWTRGSVTVTFSATDTAGIIDHYEVAIDSGTYFRTGINWSATLFDDQLDNNSNKGVGSLLDYGDGVWGQSAYFTDCSKYIQYYKTKFPTSGTIALFVRRATGSQGTVLDTVGNDDTPVTGDMQLTITPSGTLKFQLYNLLNTTWYSVESSPITENHWYHVACTYGTKGMKLYLNVAQQGSTVNFTKNRASKDVYAGDYHSDTGCNGFIGRLDCLRTSTIQDDPQLRLWPFSYKMSYKMTQEGVHTVHVKEVCKPGCCSFTEKSVTTRIDKTPPNPAIASCEAYGSSSPINVNYSGASDNTGGSGLSMVTLYYKNGVSGTWTNSGLNKTTSSGSFAFTPSSGYGTYYFDLVVKDIVGNTTPVPTSGVGTCSTIYSPPRIYVKWSSLGGDDNHDGLSWATAKATVQAGIDAAQAGGEVWVMKSCYSPPSDTNTFTLKTGVSLYGGFVGTETALSQRPVFPRPDNDPYESTLLSRSSPDNSVVTIPSGVNSATVSGFTIQGGRGHLSGSYYYGGGIFCSGTDIVIENNKLEWNAYQTDHVAGCGICVGTSGAAIMIVNNVILNNGYGSTICFYGGISVYGSCNIEHNLIKDNTSDDTYGAVYCQTSSNASVRYNDIIGNSSSGVYCKECTPIITGNRIVGNTGCGVYLYNCIESGPESPLVALNSIKGNGYGGIRCDNTPAIIHGNIVAGNSCSITGAGMRLYDSSPVVTNNTIVSNAGLNEGAGIYIGGACTPVIKNNIIAYNTSGVKWDSSGTWWDFSGNYIWENARYDYSWTSDDCENNVKEDPKLASVVYGNLHLQPDSPCIDTGDYTVDTYDLDDIDGSARVQGESIDVGADESDGASVWELGPYRIIRVSAAGNDANDGSTWSLAKRNIQSAVDAVTLEGGEVWVEATPLYYAYHHYVTLRPYVYLYGGFSGTETKRSERNRDNRTILYGYGGLDVVTIQSGRMVSTIDGFLITYGGRGIYCPASYLTIENNTIWQNESSGHGTAAYLCSGDETVFANNLVAGNATGTNCGVAYVKQSYSGGPAWMNKPRVSIMNNIITDNYGSSGYASAIYGDSSPWINIVNNTIANNDRAIFCSGGSGAIANNIIAGNIYGIVYSSSGPSDVFDNCFYGNTTDYVSPATRGTDPVLADPLLYQDFHISGSSPCIDEGYNVSTIYPANDMDYENRPIWGGSHGGGLSVDIGADEYLPTSPISFIDIQADPRYADVGVQVTITFTSSQTLSANPTVTVNGNTAAHFSHSSNNYTYHYTILGSDPHGWATVVVTGRNVNGVIGTQTNTEALFVTENCFDLNGNRTSVKDSRGTTHYEYDILGRLTKVTDPDGKWVSYTYDLNGNRKTMTDHYGGVTSYEYNSDGTLKWMADRNGRKIYYYYYYNNLLRKVTYPNSTCVEYTYDDCNQLTSVTNKKSDGTVIAGFTYLREFVDGSGNPLPGKNGTVTKVTQSLLSESGGTSQATVQYTYDRLYQLTREKRVAGSQYQYDNYYGYDAVGNLASRTSITPTGYKTDYYTYDAADRPTRAGPAAFTYINNKTIKTEGGATTSYYYNNQDLLTRIDVNNGQGSVGYTYDSYGRPMSMTTNGDTSTYRYDGDDIIFEESGQATTAYIRDDTLLYKCAGTVGSPGTYYHFDGTGDTCALSIRQSEITGTGVYDAWGVPISQTGSMSAQPYRFAGQLGGYSVPGQNLLNFGSGEAFYNPISSLVFNSPIGTTIDSMEGSLLMAMNCSSIKPSVNWLDGVQTGLDAIGLIPVFGEAADLANAGISLGRGDFLGAGLSAVSMVPIVGDVIGKGGKVARKAIVIGENMTRVRAAAKALNAGCYRARNIIPWDLALSLKRNERWIMRKIKEGYEIIDIGIDKGRRWAGYNELPKGLKSPNYILERRAISNRGYRKYRREYWPPSAAD